jgi:putative oxidoreductase
VDGGLAINGFTDLFFLLARLGLGGMIFAHGYNHLYGGGKVKGTASWFHSMGFRPAIVHAYMSGITELGCGVLLAFGLLTPLACAGVIGVMVVAYVSNHRTNGFFIFRPGEGYEYVMTISFFALLLATVGPGLWSLDQAFGVVDYQSADQHLLGWGGALIALIGGVGGGALLLATSWRPDREDPPAS